MAVLSYNEITLRKFIVVDGEPCEVLASHVFRKQQRKPVNQTKLRNLRSGKVLEISFHQNETVEEADMENKTVTYLFENRGEYWFCEVGNPKNRFTLSPNILGDNFKFAKQNTDLDALAFNDEIIGIRLPIKVDLLVKESAPAVKGNTAQGGSKIVVLETGATLTVPMFINEGDMLRINTDTGDYVERVEKA